MLLRGGSLHFENCHRTVDCKFGGKNNHKEFSNGSGDNVAVI